MKRSKSFNIRTPQPAFLSTTLLLFLFLSGSACESVDLSATHTGFEDDTVDIMIRPLGKLSQKEFEVWRNKIDVEQALRLPAKSCEGDCRFALLTVYVENRTSASFAPPVVRLDAPKNRVPRGAIAFGVDEISPGRKGRLRWLVELWPEEKSLSANISSSIFFGVNTVARPSEKPEKLKEKPMPNITEIIDDPEPMKRDVDKSPDNANLAPPRKFE
ncbi:MAG: hypothetical protein GY822_26960 [Deltaproteobacteria bacterium]|nr:hypothetical protein [Deltaproteobacteria bacterium]